MDLGSKTLGLSISDYSGVLANPYDLLRFNNYNEVLDKLEDIIKKEDIEKLVLGNPLNLDGSASDRTRESLKFKELLEKRFNLEVFMQDERFSTVEAEKLLISNNTRRKNRKKVIDKIAAVIILQSFLDRKGNNNGR